MVVVWQAYLLRAYALAVGAGLAVLGVAGLAPILPNTTAPENLLHTGVGLIYFFGGLLLKELGPLRIFVGGMGLLLVLGKVVITGGRWAVLGFFHFPFIGVVCLIAGLMALLIALFVGTGGPSES